MTTSARTFLIALTLTLVLLLQGCGQRPPHMANWFYYGQEGAVVDGWGNVNQRPSEIGWIWGNVNVMGSHWQGRIGLSNHTFSDTDGLQMTIHLISGGNQLLRISFPGRFPNVPYILHHEKLHKSIYLQTLFPILPPPPNLQNLNSIANPNYDSDGDGVPGGIEQPLLYTYTNLPHYVHPIIGDVSDLALHRTDPDTHGLAQYYGLQVYHFMGDQEVLCQVLENKINVTSETHLNRDFSKGGARWQH